ncbi:pseudouridine synthase [Pseudorhodoferax sp.]|uniref:pseudouridine synthase n=1 Tax=Pseudorhodoferax sp. TaxID=1993553 RepID=UPI0039E4C4F0
MQLQDVLYTQGFGTRRVCAGLIQQGHVAVHDGTGGLQPCTDPAREFAPQGLRLRVQGQDWEYFEKAYVLLHKPAGTECSHRPSAHPSVYTLLPAPLRQRPQRGALQGVQAVGRLDQDTTGMLLLSDDGQFIHRMTSPRKEVPKVYEVAVRHPLDDRQLDALRRGVVLNDDPRPVATAAAEVVDADGPALHLRLTLTSGKYHQVKRMLAAVGNRVEALHRSRIGALALPEGLAPGQWCWLRAPDLAALAAAS